MRHTFLASIASLVIAGGLAPAAHAAAMITSTFDTGAEGWKFGSPDFRNQTPDWDPATQSLTKSSGVAAWGYLASDAYLGDKSDYIGGTFSFDFASATLDPRYLNRPFLVLHGAINQTIYADWGPTPTRDLSRFNFELTAANFYKGTTTEVSGPVSTAEFAAIMSNLKVIEIFADWSGNVDSTRLDNVAMAANTGVPEPASWALMIMGFGLTGALMRQRRDALAGA
ncbi:PEPxxWA-CTERM sorting domain-containing protein [Phenylobacterium sp.]|uniref:PEPxxWA-CTERM sorting domain-containing protein n=1 Tax=Phenylobacterium sp. TaxID=1871053 RepID=UPI0025D0134F|nr:PEPxxWA-CTERM sorting domain-containing protein [Phenylobacterium sp.]